MRDDVMELVRNQQPFVGDRSSGALLALALEPGRLLAQLRELRLTTSHRLTGQPRRHKLQRAVNDVAEPDATSLNDHDQKTDIGTGKPEERRPALIASAERPASDKRCRYGSTKLAGKRPPHKERRARKHREARQRRRERERSAQ
ncbi:MAG TPA: hypothetical protein VFM96_03435 [Gaiellaceae bacterium]|nr:hypothetical protein [Gaiellaceae bacterium]